MRERKHELQFHDPPMSNVKEMVFEVKHGRGVWTIAKDGVFYGDYLKEEHALGAAQCAVAAILGAGGAAQVWATPASAPGTRANLPSVALDPLGCAQPSHYPLARGFWKSPGRRRSP
jgi:hypothetical protein